MCKLSLWKTIGPVGFFCAAAVIASPAQTFKSLVSFNGTDGASPNGPLVQGLDGNLYGTTRNGAGGDDCFPFYPSGCGTVFNITPGGTLTTLYSFCSQRNCRDGATPWAGLVLATDGDLYGTASWGGWEAWDLGTAFKITPGGTLTTLYRFCVGLTFYCGDGQSPSASLVLATDGNFYGTTPIGGAPYGSYGTVFEITPGGTLTTLHRFVGTDGIRPLGALVQATDGTLYGTTANGGGIIGCSDGCGTVFKIPLGGQLTKLHSFDGTDGDHPGGGLIQATDGNLYGTTGGGGASYVFGNVGSGYGTVFKITSSGTLTTLYSFCSQTDCTDGVGPGAGLVQATDGNFYGTTGGGGDPSCNPPNGCGTVFKITPSGTLTTLHSFDGTDGVGPGGALVQATDGNFYGTTATGGANGDGTVFSLSVGLGPFVKTLPTSGELGAPVMILGTDLTGATSVTFNGTAATFTVVSSSEITTTVPSGAATGKVQVTTPQGTLISNVDFRVTPSVISVTPAAATGPNVTFALAYSAAPGEAYTDLEWARVLFTGPTGVNVCRVDYYQPCEEFYLESDTGSWLGPLAAGSAQTLSNSQCTLNGRGTTVVGSGPTLTLNLSLTAASGFVGEKNIEMWVSDIQGKSSGWQTAGTWTPAPETAPAAARHSPSR
jgi:uncharacterized repeat protein (TIGR03803 family)